MGLEVDHMMSRPENVRTDPCVKRTTASYPNPCTLHPIWLCVFCEGETLRSKVALLFSKGKTLCNKVAFFLNAPLVFCFEGETFRNLVACFLRGNAP